MILLKLGTWHRRDPSTGIDWVACYHVVTDCISGLTLSCQVVGSMTHRQRERERENKSHADAMYG